MDLFKVPNNLDFSATFTDKHTHAASGVCPFNLCPGLLIAKSRFGFDSVNLEGVESIYTKVRIPIDRAG
jgi:hypothetical protein